MSWGQGWETHSTFGNQSALGTFLSGLRAQIALCNLGKLSFSGQFARSTAWLQGLGRGTDLFAASNLSMARLNSLRSRIATAWGGLARPTAAIAGASLRGGVSGLRG